MDWRSIEESIIEEAEKYGFEFDQVSLWRSNGIHYESVSIEDWRATGNLTYIIERRKLVYDDMYWNIMDIEPEQYVDCQSENNDAFSTPSYRIERATINGAAAFTKNFISEVVNRFDLSLLAFQKKTPELSRYIIEYPDDYMDGNIPLRVLAYLDMRDFRVAKSLARKSIREDDKVLGRQNMFTPLSRADRYFLERFLERQ